MKPGFEAVIGLEVHVQLLTRSKMFCGCANRYGAAPNSLTCPVCLGLPGALPVLNGEAVRMAIILGLALRAEIRERSEFYRKQYFYPDLPKGYQITQGPVAIVERGCLEIPGDPSVRGAEGPVRVGIERAHLEEDAGKSTHDAARQRSLVDLNRCGVPLLEIVGDPDLRSPAEAFAFLKGLHHLVTYLGLCDGNMEEGSLRCDANVSVRRRGEAAFGTRVEVKNVNSFRFVRQALEFEIDRQTSLLERGEAFPQETRGWDAAAGETRPQRSKEAAMDYRYFPEPDLPPLLLAPEEVAAVRAGLPELPQDRRQRLLEVHGLREQEVDTLLQSRAFADYFEAVAQAAGNAKQAANWMLGDVSRVLNEGALGLEELGMPPQHLGALIRLVETRAISLSSAREAVFPALLKGGGTPEQIVERLGLAQISDRGTLETLVREVLGANPGPVAQYRAGKASLRGFLVGQILKASRGKADARLVNEILDAQLPKPE